jgi:hypothetical protein
MITSAYCTVSSDFSPGRHSGNGSSGKEGKEGKVFAGTTPDALNLSPEQGAGQNPNCGLNLVREHSPHSPGQRSGNGVSGNEGKEGKVFAGTGSDAVNSMDAEEATPGRWSAQI